MTVLRRGMHGAAVRRLQSLLSASQALQQPLVADGHFGNLTHATVTAFRGRTGSPWMASSAPKLGWP